MLLLISDANILIDMEAGVQQHGGLVGAEVAGYAHLLLFVPALQFPHAFAEVGVAQAAVAWQLVRRLRRALLIQVARRGHQHRGAFGQRQHLLATGSPSHQVARTMAWLRQNFSSNVLIPEQGGR